MSMNINGRTTSSITQHWPTQDVSEANSYESRGANRHQVIYVAVIAPVMMAAAVEWFLFLAAFLYCLCKVFLKAEHWSIRVLAVLMMVLFAVMRYEITSYNPY